ncbi:MAG: phosphodiester glycosidase family protein [Fretibacterium sp.]|nr:phosphodiester glycosidase family protein [Fretibacterium sp.]
MRFLRNRAERAALRGLSALLLLWLSVLAAEAAPSVSRGAFLSGLLEARGLSWNTAKERSGAAFVLRSGLVTERVKSLDAPATRREALRWVVQALGLEVEARILSNVPVSFKDAGGLSAYERGCLTVATRMAPPLIQKAKTFRGDHKLTDREAASLLSAVRKASANLLLEVTFSPVAGTTLHVHRSGVATAVPKWRVYADGFDDKPAVEAMQRFLKGKGFEMTASQPNYEWHLRSALLEDYAQVRRLADLIRSRRLKVRVLPSVSNVSLETAPRYWVMLTLDPDRYKLEPILPPEGVSTLAPLSEIARAARVRAAINGGFFSVTGRGRGAPIGTLRVGGALVNKPYQGRTCLGWNDENEAAFGEVLWSGSVRTEQGDLALNAVNRFVKGDTLVLYTPHYGASTPLVTSVPAAEVVVRNGRSAGLRFGGGPLEPGSWVLAGYGSNAALLEGYFPVGAAVGVQSELTGNGGESWSEMKNIVQAGPFLLSDGEVRVDAEGFGNSLVSLRHPRSVVGLTEDGRWFFMVIDGRNGLHASGATLEEAAEILSAHDVAYALNLDGGGSSEILIDGKLYNAPSEGRERPVSNGIGARNKK